MSLYPARDFGRHELERLQALAGSVEGMSDLVVGGRTARLEDLPTVVAGRNNDTTPAIYCKVALLYLAYGRCLSSYSSCPYPAFVPTIAPTIVPVSIIASVFGPVPVPVGTAQGNECIEP